MTIAVPEIQYPRKNRKLGLKDTIDETFPYVKEGLILFFRSKRNNLPENMHKRKDLTRQLAWIL